MPRRFLFRKLLLVLIVGVLAPLFFSVHFHSESKLRSASHHLHTYAIVRHWKAGACAHSKAAAAASAAADSIAAASSSSWPVIINASLVQVDRHYIDGWVVKGADIVATAVFEGWANSNAIHLIDARGAALPCKAEQITYAGNDLCAQFVFVPLRTHFARNFAHTSVRQKTLTAGRTLCAASPRCKTYTHACNGLVRVMPTHLSAAVAALSQQP